MESKKKETKFYFLGMSVLKACLFFYRNHMRLRALDNRQTYAYVYR